ncbi:alpha/beta hydrolase [Mesorhizobium sp. CAU 1732]|uniref:alpha/beta hydrolase n=1 Tax=Mesorhizobium sp. CAU 1732 TaxID=3140358 RepID=UPI00326074AE
MVNSVSPVSRADVFKAFQTSKPGKRQAFVFVHGYNTPFDRAVFRFAQLSMPTPCQSYSPGRRVGACSMGLKRPRITLFVSQNDRALRLSRLIARGGTRLGAIALSREEYRRQLVGLSDVTVLDLSALSSGDRIDHALYANSPAAVRLIGDRLLHGQVFDDWAAADAGMALDAMGSAGIMSNTTTTLLVIPIGMKAAESMDISPHPVLKSLCIAGAAAFLTPIATTCNMLVMGPGDTYSVTTGSLDCRSQSGSPLSRYFSCRSSAVQTSPDHDRWKQAERLCEEFFLPQSAMTMVYMGPAAQFLDAPPIAITL